MEATDAEATPPTETAGKGEGEAVQSWELISARYQELCRTVSELSERWPHDQIVKHARAVKDELSSLRSQLEQAKKRIHDLEQENGEIFNKGQYAALSSVGASIKLPMEKVTFDLLIAAIKAQISATTQWQKLAEEMFKWVGGGAHRRDFCDIYANARCTCGLDSLFSRFEELKKGGQK